MGAEGEIGGRTAAISALSAAKVANAGHIDGYFSAITLGAGGSVTNTGLIESENYSPYGSASVESHVNGGTMKGAVTLGGGSDSAANSGLIDGQVELGDGADLFTNYRTVSGSTRSGTVTGEIDLGAGDDRFLGGAKPETVLDNQGADTVSLGSGNDVFLAANESSLETDTIPGGTGTDLYSVEGALYGAQINLDRVAHDFGPLLPGTGGVPAGLATIGVAPGVTATDRISGSEDARGGNGYDVIHGSGAANVLEGMGGNDTLSATRAAKRWQSARAATPSLAAWAATC